MKVTVLKDVLIARGELDRYYQGTVPGTLWRALKRDTGGSPLDFVEDSFVLSNGRPRAADITIVDGPGGRWVKVKDRPRGVSTFDRRGVPPGKGWDYYRIPAGTALPEGSPSCATSATRSTTPRTTPSRRRKTCLLPASNICWNSSRACCSRRWSDGNL